MASAIVANCHFVFILLLLVRLVIKLIGNVFRLPVLRQIDGILGGLFGIFKGAVYIFWYVFCYSC